MTTLGNVVRVAAVACFVGFWLTAQAAAQPRIVTIGSSVTEIVYALGAGGNVVAVDATSYYPDAANRLPKVGYWRSLSAEGILSVRPEIVVSVDEAGPPRVFEQLRDGGTRLQLVQDKHSPVSVVEKIRTIAAAIGATERGTAIADAVAADIARVSAAVEGVSRRPRVLFLLGVGRGPPQASGGGTAADAIIKLAGGQNAISGYTGYKPLSVESALSAEPDALLMMSQTVEALGGESEVLRLPPVAATAAGRAGRLIIMDGIYLLGFGPRTAHAMRDLAAKLHPGLPLPSLPERAWTQTALAAP